MVSKVNSSHSSNLNSLQSIKINDLNRLKELLTYPHEAIQELFFLLGFSCIDSLEEIYECIFKLLPHFSTSDFEKFKKDILSRFLRNHSQSLNLQRRLAKELALLQFKVACSQGAHSVSFFEGMDLCGKLIQLSIALNAKQLIEESHLLASRFLFQAYLKYLKDELDAAKRKGDWQKWKEIVDRIEKLDAFCCSDKEVDDAKELIYALKNVLPAEQNSYDELGLIALKKREIILGVSERRATADYYKALCKWRDEFGNFLNIKQSYSNFLEQKTFKVQIVRVFQRETTERFRDFFCLLLRDVFTVFGPPPCACDFRAMGSVGREEICPFSDLELFVLYEKKECLEYFKKALQLLELQIRSLGEDNQLPIVFTSIHTVNPSGFHLDSGGNPNQNPELLIGPEKFAVYDDLDKIKKAQSYILESHGDPQITDYTSQRSVSVFSHPPQNEDLIQLYQKSLFVILDQEPPQANLKLRHLWGLDLLKKRVSNPERNPLKMSERGIGFVEKWSFPPIFSQLNLKEHYVQLLNFMLADLALYAGITETNTLDIIDALSKQKNMFSEKTCEILKDAVAFIYLLRNRVHLHYHQQKEEVSFQPDLSEYVLEAEEQARLKRYYWIVLRPLYTALKKITMDRQPLETVFHQFDLIEWSCQDFLSQIQEPFALSYFSSLSAYLTHEEHTSLFLKISQLPHADRLIQIYYSLLKHNSLVDSLVFQKLSVISTSSGMRLLLLKSSQNLQEALVEITRSDPPDSDLHATVTKVKIITSKGTQRYLPLTIIKEIMDEKGNINKFPLYSTSAHPVYPVGKLHFKQKPSQPLMEYAIHNLAFRIAGRMTPSTELVKFEVTVRGQTRTYPVLISETIFGKCLKDTIQKNLTLTPQAWSQWTWMVLLAILTRPGDGRFSNYLLDDQNYIFCVDNDVSFVEPVVKDGLFSRKIQFYSALFCMFTDRPLDPDVLKQFSLLNADAILNSWMEDLIHKEKEYDGLFSEREKKELFDEDPTNPFISTVLFREGTIALLNWQFCHLQNFLFNQTRPITSLELLQQLIYTQRNQVEGTPGILVASAYKKALQHSSPEMRLKQATSRTQDQSLSSLQSYQACLGKIPSLQELERREKWTPVVAQLELFKTVLFRNHEFVKEGILQGRRVLHANFKKIGGANQPDIPRQTAIIEALIGFGSLGPKPISVALQYCSIVDTSYLEFFLHPDLEYLDLQFCPLIEDADILIIRDKCPKLKSLNLSGCQKITKLETGRFFSDYLEFSELQELRLDWCENLVTIRLRALQLKFLSANHNPKLRVADIIAEMTAEFSFKNSPSVDPNQLIETLSKNLSISNFAEIDPTELIKKKSELVSSLKNNKALEEKLVSIIKASAHAPNLARAAANAITILGLTDFSFRGLDFRGVRIPRAILHNVDFSNVDLREADLSSISFNGTLTETRLDKAIMKSVQFESICHSGIKFYEMIFSKSGPKVIAVNPDGYIYLWDLKTGILLRTIYTQHSKSILRILLSENGRYLVSQDSQCIKIWDTEFGILDDTIFTFSSCLCWVDENKIAFMKNGFVAVHDLKNGQTCQSKIIIDLHPNGIYSLDHGEKILVSGRYADIIDCASMQEVEEIKTDNLRGHFLLGRYICIDYKRKIGVPYGNSIKIVDLGKSSSEIKGHGDRVTDLELLEPGKTIASSSNDQTIRIWDVSTRKMLCKISVPFVVTRIKFKTPNLLFGIGPSGICSYQLNISKLSDEPELLWINRGNRLDFRGTKIENIQALSEENRQLMLKNGAVL